MRSISSYEEFSGIRDTVTTVEALRRLVRKALRDGVAKEVAPGRWEVLYQMNCEQPFLIRSISRSHISRKKLAMMSVHAIYRCRKCAGCMVSKGRFWAARVCTEYREWPVTLMGTFNCSPQQHALLAARASAKVDTGGLPQKKLFNLLAKEFYGEVQSYLNRLRSAVFERNGGKTGVMRYLFVAERHDSVRTSAEMRGKPHFHCIMHETERSALILGDPRIVALKQLHKEPPYIDGEYVGKKYQNSHGEWVDGVFLADDSEARKQWQFGFSKYQVCFSEESAFYVCKYLGKDGSYKVNPSLHYGDAEWLAKHGTASRTRGGIGAPPRAEQSGVSNPLPEQRD